MSKHSVKWEFGRIHRCTYCKASLMCFAIRFSVTICSFEIEPETNVNSWQKNPMPSSAPHLVKQDSFILLKFMLDIRETVSSKTTLCLYSLEQRKAGNYNSRTKIILKNQLKLLEFVPEKNTQLISKLLLGVLLNSLFMFSFEHVHNHKITHPFFHTSKLCKRKKQTNQQNPTLANFQFIQKMVLRYYSNGHSYSILSHMFFFYTLCCFSLILPYVPILDSYTSHPQKYCLDSKIIWINNFGAVIETSAIYTDHL